MTNEKLKKQFNDLNKLLAQHKKSIDLSEQSINLSMELVLKNANADEIKQAQTHVKTVKTLLSKAKESKSIEGLELEIKNYTKNIKDAR